MAEEKQTSRNAEGFCFLSTEDAGLATREKKHIEYLESVLDYQQPEQVLMLYDKALRERIFKTPVGMIYLKHLQNFLMNKTDIDPARVPMIPVYAPCNASPVKRERPRANARKKAEEEKRTAKMRISLILNILLVIAIIAMFIMTTQSDSPNILNYRTAILNEYASWEQDLSEREQVIREKERELKITQE